MRASAKPKLLRITIPLLRLLPFYAGLWAILGGQFITYAPPLQKLFYARLVDFVWGCLAITPFVLLRSTLAFRIYMMLFLCCLTFMAYDYFVPFRYIAPGFQGEVQDLGGGYSRRGNDDSIDYWISYPILPPLEAEMLFKPLVLVAPLVLAFVYRRYYPLWTANT